MGWSKSCCDTAPAEKTAFNDYLASTTSERKQTDAVIAWCNAITTEEKCTDDCEYIHGAKPICIPTIVIIDVEDDRRLVRVFSKILLRNEVQNQTNLNSEALFVMQ